MLKTSRSKVQVLHALENSWYKTVEGMKDGRRLMVKVKEFVIS
jgi:hypothetical protein